MLVMFPVTLLIGTWACDILLATSRELVWATLGLITLGLGIVTALLAAVFGLVDYFGDTRVRVLRSANLHLVANLIVVAIAIGNWIGRYSGGPGWIMDLGIILSTATVLLLGYSGWKGATLVYKHGVGVDSGATDRQGR
jgi:uncharacterized membrane protein